MEKLVVRYDYGGFECSGTEVICLEYESAEALYVHLEEKVTKFIKDRAEHQAKWKILRDEYGELAKEINRIRNKKDRDSEKNVELVKTMGDRVKVLWDQMHDHPTNKAVLGSWEFNMEEFVTADRDPMLESAQQIVDMPEIYRLEEWFDHYCVRYVGQ